MTHTCHAAGCDVPVSPSLLMCPAHWRLVPRALQQAVWAAYRRGQEIDKRPSPEYLAAAQAAIGAVARAGGSAQLGLFGDLPTRVKR